VIKKVNSNNKYSGNVIKTVSESKKTIVIKKPKKKLLLIGTSPEEFNGKLERIHYDREFRKIQDILHKDSNNYLDQPNIVLASRIKDMRTALLRYHPDILHISSHGFSQGIILEDDDGFPVEINANALINLLRQFSDTIKCIFFNSCRSSYIASQIFHDIEFTIGMSESISDETAIKFSESFYEALSYGQDFESAYRIAKNSLELENIPEMDIPSIFIRGS